MALHGRAHQSPCREWLKTCYVGLSADSNCLRIRYTLTGTFIHFVRSSTLHLNCFFDLWFNFVCVQIWTHAAVCEKWLSSSLINRRKRYFRRLDSEKLLQLIGLSTVFVWHREHYSLSTRCYSITSYSDILVAEIRISLMHQESQLIGDWLCKPRHE